MTAQGAQSSRNESTPAVCPVWSCDALVKDFASQTTVREFHELAEAELRCE
jgi:hypothetical protein